MEEARKLINAFHEINNSTDRKVALFTPALVGMIGSGEMFDDLLSQFEAALVSGKIAPSLKERAVNLAVTFIPQVAGLNSVTDLSPDAVTAERLRAISADAPDARRDGVKTILSALLRILKAVTSLD